jgi:acyl homoserine lactone synthase
MMHTIQTRSHRDMGENCRRQMHLLRTEVFAHKLGWEVVVTDDGLEVDEFDSLPTTRYIFAQDSDGTVDACWRLLPTSGGYMLRDTFPQLLHGQEPPMAADVWELSRFAVATDRVAASDSAVNNQIGFGDLSVALMREAARFALDNGIARYVTVTTAAIERLMKKLNLSVHRLGPPVRIGNVLTVACFIEVDHQTLRAVGLR